MPEYKLTYFTLQALGEPIRFLLSYGKKDFEDYRIPREEWPEHKKNYPLGKLPILEIDGKAFNQSISICRYVAKEVGLSGKNSMEDLEIDGIVDSIIDLRLANFNYFMEQNPEAKEQKKNLLFNEAFPTILKYLETKAKQNDGHLAVKRLTWADVIFAAYANPIIVTAGAKNVLKDKPLLKALIEKVHNLPGIKEYVATRPETPF